MRHEKDGTQTNESKSIHYFRGAKNSTLGRGIGEAMAEGERITNELKQGGVSSQQMARENSACPSGKRNGGDLGWFAPEDMVIEFSSACAKIPKGELGPHPVVSRHPEYTLYGEQVKREFPK